MLLLWLYYWGKPFLPRSLVLALRRIVAKRRYRRVKGIWPIKEAAGVFPEGWQGWPEGKQFALILTHDVEGPRGVERCLAIARLEKDLDFRSCFNFVPEPHPINPAVRDQLLAEGFEVGVHGLRHDGLLFMSRRIFESRRGRINHYLRDWKATGFRAPCMMPNLEWIGDLDIEYDSSTFDTDPFEPIPAGVGTVFPFWVPCRTDGRQGYVELPYTLPQDFTLFVLLRQKDISLWQKKVEWLAKQNAMVLLNVHPDYVNGCGGILARDEYPLVLYEMFLKWLRSQWDGQYWHALPREVARFWVERYVNKES